MDDVFTTEATSDACSRALFAAGAASVYALTGARAIPLHGDFDQTAPPPDQECVTCCTCQGGCGCSLKLTRARDSHSKIGGMKVGFSREGYG